MAEWSNNRFGLAINKSFRAQFRPLSNNERAGLENDLIAAGKAFDPVIVRAKTNEILDGHNRFELCEARRLPYRIESVDLKTDDDCIAWIQKKQINRRNITQQEREAAARILYEQLSKQKATPTGTSTQPQKNIVEQVAAATGETKRTTQRRLQRAELSDKLSSKLKADYDAGTLKLDDKELKALSGLPKHEQSACYAAVKSGDYGDIKDALVANGALPKPEPQEEEPQKSEEASPAPEALADITGKGAGEAVKTAEKLIRHIDNWGKCSPGDKYDRARAKIDDLYDHLVAWAKAEDEAF